MSNSLRELSAKEVEIVSWLEFYERYFFGATDIERFAKDQKQRYNIISRFLRKGRIVKLNRRKYYLIPMKAKSGSWTEHPFIIVDEIMDGKDYCIGGWAAASYWRLTEQIPMRTDVYTTRRYGPVRLLNTRIFFHHTTRRALAKGVSETIQGHAFRILPKEESRKWLKSHQ